MNKDKVTIVVPVHNATEHVKRLVGWQGSSVPFYRGGCGRTPSRFLAGLAACRGGESTHLKLFESK